MATHAPHRPHRPHGEDADETEPGMLPVEPDTGPVPPGMPVDPEHEPAADPEA
jgi:hypothetical protein